MGIPSQPGGRGTSDEPYELPDEEEPLDLTDEPGQFDLVILNDDTHTYEYVIALFHDLFGISWDFGYGIDRIHDSGRWARAPSPVVIRRRFCGRACG